MSNTIKSIVENITALNDGQHSWQERYDYNMRLVKSICAQEYERGLEDGEKRNEKLKK